MTIEEKLCKYHGYAPRNVDKWKSQLTICTRSINKILKCIQILTGHDIRELFRQIVADRKDIIESDDCYICQFGPTGKSGGLLLYEFVKACKHYKEKIIESWEIPSLPEGSKIIFIDDIVGTGRQSTEYITTKLNKILNSSHKGFLICLCATPQGIKRVEDNTNISVIPGCILDERTKQYLNDKCDIFNREEKEYLKNLNERIHDYSRGFYANMGLLLAFYFSVPNNTLPFIWKEKAVYVDDEGITKKWNALLPRDY